MTPEKRRAIERRLGFRFSRPELLEGALTHSSAKTEQRPSNERLEFLGDAVIGLIVSHFLFVAFPEKDEGELTRLKSVVVSEPSLAEEARRAGLDEALELGKGIPRSAIPASVLANGFEAVTGAILLDGGIEAARAFVLEALAPSLELVLGARHARNWKSLLQQFTQRAYGLTPVYEVVQAVGPEHGKRFEVQARVEGEAALRGEGTGRSKKEAEQDAAHRALATVLGDPGDQSDAEVERLLEEAATAIRDRRTAAKNGDAAAP